MSYIYPYVDCWDESMFDREAALSGSPIRTANGQQVTNLQLFPGISLSDECLVGVSGGSISSWFLNGFGTCMEDSLMMASESKMYVQVLIDKETKILSCRLDNEDSIKYDWERDSLELVAVFEFMFDPNKLPTT